MSEYKLNGKQGGASIKKLSDSEASSKVQYDFASGFFHNPYMDSGIREGEYYVREDKEGGNKL